MLPAGQARLPATASAASSRSSSVCCATAKAVRWRSRCSRATSSTGLCRRAGVLLPGRAARVQAADRDGRSGSNAGVGAARAAGEDGVSCGSRDAVGGSTGSGAVSVGSRRVSALRPMRASVTHVADGSAWRGVTPGLPLASGLETHEGHGRAGGAPDATGGRESCAAASVAPRRATGWPRWTAGSRPGADPRSR